MKALLVLLVASLAANAALYLTRRAPASAAPSATVVETNAASTAGLAAAGKPASSPATPAARADATVSADIWALIKAGAPAGVEKLRALGFPEDAIRALVAAQVNELFREREKAVGADPSKALFWKSDYSRRLYTPQNRSAATDLRREKQLFLKQLLGAGYDAEQQNYPDARMAGIAPEKAQKLRWMEEDFNAIAADIRGDDPNALLLADDREQLAYLEKEKRAELAQLLTPEELQTYDLRTSRTASSLRYQLSALEPTEAEFLAIFEHQKTVDEKFGAQYGRMPRTEREARQKAQTEADAQIKQALGPERYADYERAKDYSYQSLHNVGTELKLPKTQIVAAYDTRKSFEKKLNEVRPKGTGPDAIKSLNEGRAAISREAAAALIQIIGQPAFDRYKAAGGWSQFDYVMTPPSPAPKG